MGMRHVQKISIIVKKSEQPKKPVNERVAYNCFTVFLFHCVQLKINHVIVRSNVLEIKCR